MTPTQIITQIIQIITGCITELAGALGQGISSIVQSVMFTGTGSEQALSIFAILMLVFCGLNLGFSLFRWGLNFVTSLGRKNG